MSETLKPALPGHLDEQVERLMHAICDREPVKSLKEMLEMLEQALAEE